MFTPLHCIALHTVRHSDTRSILTAWSAELGRISIGMPDGKGREAARRRALTMPLAMFEAVGDVRPGRDIISVRDLRPSAGSPASAPPTPARTMLQLFLADALDRILRQSAPDPLLSDFIFDSLRRLARLSRPTALANFHIVFLFRMARFLGIAPDTDIPAGASPEKMIFDLREASFLVTDFLLRVFQQHLVSSSRGRETRREAYIRQHAPRALHPRRALAHYRCDNRLLPPAPHPLRLNPDPRHS